MWTSGRQHPKRSFAVDIGEGLITPIIRSADIKSLSQINSETKELVSKAQEKKLKPEEFMGGTFTISNLGGFGVNNFSAVINPPQTCILAIGSTEKQLKINPDYLGIRKTIFTNFKKILKLAKAI